MLDFKTKRKIKDILYSRVAIGLLGIIFIFFANSALSVYKKARFASDNKEMAENSLNKLKAREKFFSHKIDILKTPRGVEEEIRGKFGLVKKGEEVVVVVGSDNNKKNNNKKNNISVIGKWWGKFIGSF